MKELNTEAQTKKGTKRPGDHSPHGGNVSGGHLYFQRSDPNE